MARKSFPIPICLTIWSWFLRHIKFIDNILKVLSHFQKKRLSITHSFGSEHSDSSDGLVCGAMDSPPRTPGLSLLASDKDRSSTPLSSGSEERQFVVKVMMIISGERIVSTFSI